MTATIYAIKDWADCFTVSQSAKVKGSLSWLALPINLTGDHYRVLMQSESGRAAYAVFVSLCCVAANCPNRGVLADRDGKGLSLRSLHHKTGIPEKPLSDAITLLLSPDIGWLVARSEHAGSTLVARSESEPSPLSSFISSSLSETEPEQTESTTRLLWNQVSPIFEAYPTPNRGSRGEFTRAVGSAWSALKLEGVSNPGERLLSIVKAYASSWKAKQDGGRFTVGPDRFFEHNGHWRNDPSVWDKPKLNGTHDMSRILEISRKGKQ